MSHPITTRIRPLPGQKDPGASLAAPAAADQVEDTPTLEQFHRWLSAVSHEALFDAEHPPADLHSAYHAIHWDDCMTVVANCRIATSLLMQFKHEPAPAQVGQVEGTPLPRLFRSPVGAWVHLHKRPYFVAYLTCGAATRQGVLTSERRA